MINKVEVSKQLSELFATKQKNAKLNANINFEKALKNENFKTSFYKIRSLQFDLSKLEDSSNEAKQILKQIEEERKTLNAELKNCGFTKDDLKPQYECKKCNDKGFINNVPCQCYKTEQSKLFLKESGINKQSLPQFSNINYSLFGDAKTQENIKHIYSSAKDFIFDNTQTLVILGKTGVGKTYLSECVLNEAINNRVFSIFTTAFNMNNSFLDYHTSNYLNKQDILSPYLTCDLLIIDDLGSEIMFDNLTKEYLYLILDTRQRNNLKTLISSNLTLEQLQSHYDDRVFSRLINKQAGNKLFNMTGANLRFKK